MYKIFIDFDDVLFNTKSFSSRLKSFFESHGVVEDYFEKYYYDPADTGEVKLFNPWAMLDRIEKGEKIDVDGIRNGLGEFMADTSEFVFEDVDEFLSMAGVDNIYIVSFGIPQFQQKKIFGCGLGGMVKKIVITDKMKDSAIRELIESGDVDAGETMFFIDDRVDQIRSVKQNFPAIRTIFLHRAEGRYCDQKQECCDYEAHDLNEVEEIIKSIK